MALLDRKQAEDFTEGLIKERVEEFFSNLHAGSLIDEFATGHDVIIDDEDWDLIHDLINSTRLAIVPWGEGE